MSKLILPHEIYVQKFTAKERIVTLPNGKRVRVHTDDSGTVTHIESADTLDAIVRPKTARLTPRRPK